MDTESVEDNFIQLFDLSPETFAWRTPIPHQIERRRADMADQLIFDILLSSGGIRNPSEIYPPRDEKQLRTLLERIEETTYDGMKIDCLIYFLLKWHKDGRDATFASDHCIPPQFIALADAYWYLDSGEDVPRAVSLLSDARLNRDYPSKIIQAISLEKSNANALVLRYIRSAKPLLKEPNDIDAYSIALAESSLLEAWQYQRTFSEQDPTRVRVLRNILRWSLSPRPRATPLTQLLSFPLNNYEQSQLHEFALHPPSNLPPTSIPVIQDLACVRLIHSGQLAAAVKLDRQFTLTSVPGANGGQVIQDRKQTIEEILSVMPAAERQLLELELEQISQNTDTSLLNGNVADLSMSWEHIRAPQTNGTKPPNNTPLKVTNRAEPLIPPIPERSGAPRFGGPIQPPKPSPSNAFTAARNVFDKLAKQSPSQTRPLVPSDTAPVIASIQAPATGYLASEVDVGASPSPKSAKRKEPVSLFDTVGSAKRVPNAFFNPSPVSAGTKRKSPDVTTPTKQTPAKRTPARQTPQKQIAQDDFDVSTTSAMDVSAMLNEVAEPDVEMHDSEGERNQDILAQLDEEEKPVQDEEAPEFSVSVFSSRRPRRSLANDDAVQPKATSPEVLPGAFEPEPEADQEIPQDEPAAAGAMVLEELETPPRPPPKRKASPPPRRARAPRLAKEPSLTQSLPGAFIHDHDAEEDDHVPPLPPPTPATRRQTRRRASNAKVEEDTRKEPAAAATPARRTRRSSRLSVASSAGSSSPEPPSPEKRTSTRTSAKVTRQASANSISTRSTRARKQR